jgi:hypothetical protein
MSAIREATRREDAPNLCPLAPTPTQKEEF